MTTVRNAARYRLVAAGHHFLIAALPLDRLQTEAALDTFVAAVRRMDPLPADLEAALLRCLAVLNRYAEARIPSLVDAYLSGTAASADYPERFSECVKDLVRFHGIRDGMVQDALALVNQCHSEAGCTPPMVAGRIGVRLATLDVAFKRETGRTLTEHIREVRLDDAAVELATTNKSIKEVWAQVGYNHHSNFDHDFKRRFGVAPREYRARALRPVARAVFDQADVPPAGDHAAARSGTAGIRVLVVDDDEASRTTVATWLQHEGHSVRVSASGAEGLRDAERFAPDAILLDYQLGDMDGVHCLRVLRGAASGPRPSVAIFTADWDILDRSDEVAALDAMVASKLCDLERVSDLVVYLTSEAAGRREPPLNPSWKIWTRFL